MTHEQPEQFIVWPLGDDQNPGLEFPANTEEMPDAEVAAERAMMCLCILVQCPDGTRHKYRVTQAYVERVDGDD